MQGNRSKRELMAHLEWQGGFCARCYVVRSRLDDCAEQ